MLSVVFIAIALALIFDFLNGMNDAGNSIATIVATRVLPPFAAVLWAACWNFVAYFIFGVTVATTVGKGIIVPTYMNEYLVLSALIGAVIWVFTCTRLGLPISVSHSLIGGLIGPVWFTVGTKALVGAGIWKIVCFIVLAPLIGMIVGLLMMCLTLFLFRRKSPLKVDHWFRYMQLFSSAIFSVSHGGNDAQKTMGIIAILLFAAAPNSEFISAHLFDPTRGFYVPEWLVITCYLTIAAGTMSGGWKTIKTLGHGVADIKPVQGFCAETAGAISVIFASLLGVPVSTTHTITGSIIGTSLPRSVSSVRWAAVKKIVTAWVLTIPMTILVAGGVHQIILLFLGK